MNGTVTVKQFINRIPPAYQAEWNGHPLIIALDSSAILKLGTADPDGDPIAILRSNQVSIAAAAQRLIAMRVVTPSPDGLTVTLSALDLN
jgi:hypothetical protein